MVEWSPPWSPWSARSATANPPATLQRATGSRRWRGGEKFEVVKRSRRPEAAAAPKTTTAPEGAVVGKAGETAVSGLVAATAADPTEPKQSRREERQRARLRNFNLVDGVGQRREGD